MAANLASESCFEVCFRFFFGGEISSESESGEDFTTEADMEAEGVEIAREEGGVDSSFTRVWDLCSASAFI